MTVPTLVELADELRKRLDDMCKREERTLKYFISKGLTELFDRMETPKKAKAVDDTNKSKNISIKKPDSWKAFFKLYPQNKKGGSDQTAWKKAKSLKLTDDDFKLMIDNIKKRKEFCPNWYRQFAEGITKYIGEQIWLTEIVPEMSNDGQQSTEFKGWLNQGDVIEHE